MLYRDYNKVADTGGPDSVSESASRHERDATVLVYFYVTCVVRVVRDQIELELDEKCFEHNWIRWWLTRLFGVLLLLQPLRPPHLHN